jgi:hypothetical protein
MKFNEILEFVREELLKTIMNPLPMGSKKSGISIMNNISEHLTCRCELFFTEVKQEV